MKIEDFDKKYKDKGGIAKLRELSALCYSRSYIARYFGVTNSSVYQWNYMFFESGYILPRSEDIVLFSMIEFAKRNPLSEFRFAFKGGKYYNEGLSRVKKEIYGK